MNKKEQKRYAKTYLNSLKKKVLKVIDLFPLEKDWDDRHIMVAIRQYLDYGYLSTSEEMIEVIKQSYACRDEGWVFSDGNEDIPSY